MGMPPDGASHDFVISGASGTLRAWRTFAGCWPSPIPQCLLRVLRRSAATVGSQLAACAASPVYHVLCCFCVGAVRVFITLLWCLDMRSSIRADASALRSRHSGQHLLDNARWVADGFNAEADAGCYVV